MTETSTPVNWSKWLRQIHRWLAMAFTLGFIANLFGLGLKPYPVWLGLMALVPLLLLLATGLYLFFLPHVLAWRSPRRTA